MHQCQVATETATTLDGQTKQMEGVLNSLDEIHFSLKKANQVIRDITRRLATDKCATTAWPLHVCMPVGHMLNTAILAGCPHRPFSFTQSSSWLPVSALLVVMSVSKASGDSSSGSITCVYPGFIALHAGASWR